MAVAVAVDLRDFRYEGSVNGDVVFEAASLLKVPLAMALEERATLGRLELSERHAMEQIRSRPGRNSLMMGLVDTESLSTEELIRLTLITSDELAAHQLRTVMHEQDVNAFLDRNHCPATRLFPPQGHVSVAGTTTASEAVRLLTLATNVDIFPITASALGCSTMYSRIPLGVTGLPVEVAHKTASLPGIAHDVAQLATSEGRVRLAFLSRNQKDTVVAGYRMAPCTRELLEICGVSVSSSLSVMRDVHG